MDTTLVLALVLVGLSLVLRLVLARMTPKATRMDMRTAAKQATPERVRFVLLMFGGFFLVTLVISYFSARNMESPIGTTLAYLPPLITLGVAARFLWLRHRG